MKKNKSQGLFRWSYDMASLGVLASDGVSLLGASCKFYREFFDYLIAEALAL
jgi:hypothetical protein